VAPACDCRNGNGDDEKLERSADKLRAGNTAPWCWSLLSLSWRGS